MTSHVFAETTHVVAAPCGFVCVVIPRRSYRFQVSSKCIHRFLNPGGRMPIPITSAIGYRTSSDYTDRNAIIVSGRVHFMWVHSCLPNLTQEWVDEPLNVNVWSNTTVLRQFWALKMICNGFSTKLMQKSFLAAYCNINPSV